MTVFHLDLSRILLDSVVAGHWHTQVIGGAAPLSDRDLQGDFIQMLFPGKIALQADTYLPDASASSGISAPADVARADPLQEGFLLPNSNETHSQTAVVWDPQRSNWGLADLIAKVL
uniref:Uncharacterized protein n=1 Tax=Coccidioides posadasii RMSCC 3488 TaxID=454284 RepID=A0A0J6FI47_COCPO|nr:hypothetical protein CPAG_05378 [Coccidioides posadasii RMSCC 3488]